MRVIIDSEGGPDPVDAAQLVRLERLAPTTQLIRRIYLCLVCDQQFEAPVGQQVEHRCSTPKTYFLRR
jgi:hypothetical protein